MANAGGSTPDRAPDQNDRAARLGQEPLVIWFTGLSGAGKTTLAGRLERELLDRGHHAFVLDGDRLRSGLNSDLGFSAADRDENMRRVAETARLFFDAGLIVITACISPLRAHRDAARSLIPPGRFVEVALDTPLAVCERRDVKGLYRRARAGLIPDFTGIDAPYEVPAAPEMRLPAGSRPPDACVRLLLDYLRGRGLVR